MRADGKWHQETDVELFEDRLETPAMIGYRAGMSSTGVIAAKLSRIYTPAAEAPRDILELASVLDRELGLSR